MRNPSDTTKAKLLAGIVLAAIALAYILPPIPQDAAYHQFADSRTLFGIPNFWNVVTNAPFLVTGLLGAVMVWSGPLPGGLRELRPCYLTFFLGFALIGPGSAYYHLAPSNDTLFWDRLPISVSFMAFLAAIIGESIDQSVGRRLLWPLVAAGMAAVVYWRMTEAAGRGDLTPYVLVQFLPMLLIPLILILFKSRLTRADYVWSVLGMYATAKVAELKDAELYSLSGMSGHSLKHFFAALATALFLLALKRRRTIH